MQLSGTTLDRLALFIGCAATTVIMSLIVDASIGRDTAWSSRALPYDLLQSLYRRSPFTAPPFNTTHDLSMLPSGGLQYPLVIFCPPIKAASAETERCFFAPSQLAQGSALSTANLPLDDPLQREEAQTLRAALGIAEGGGGVRCQPAIGRHLRCDIFRGQRWQRVALR